MDSIKIFVLILLFVFPVMSSSAKTVVILNESMVQLDHVVDFVELSNANGEKIKLSPLFRKPVDSAKQVIWSELGMNRWFLLENSTEISEEDLQSCTSIDETHSFPFDQVPYTVPNDYNNFDLWHLENLNCPTAWNESRPQGEIVMATIDTGCDIFHEDLSGNIYVNPGEDLNRNGIFELEDLNGYDDDGNGMTDDICGWDFFDIDSTNAWEYLFTRLEGEDYFQPDPFVYPDIYGHGTLVTGLQAAVTNNSLGLASAGWNLKTIPIRTAGTWLNREGQLVAMGSPIEFARAVYYAVNVGAKIISISFGSNNENHLYETALEYANENDVLVVCAAGNSNSESRTYPAGYETTVAVASVDNNNVKAGDSNYGSWVDICAPGVNVWSTFSNNVYHPLNYLQASGTSVAAPVVASVAGLALATNQLFTVDDLKILIQSSSYNLDTSNPEYIGQLGAGVINADLMIQNVLHPIWNPENLVLNFEDASSTATLEWDVRRPGTEEEEFLRYEIFRNGEYRAQSEAELFTEAIEISGLVEYKIRAVYQRGESNFTNSAYVYNVNPATVSPDSSEVEIVDTYLGETHLKWKRCSNSDSLRFDDIIPVVDGEILWKRCCQSTWATKFHIDDLARLTTLKVLARNTGSDVLTVQVYPFEGESPTTVPIITKEITDLSEGWNSIDVFGESIILDGEFLISAKSTSLSVLEIAYMDSTIDQSYYLSNEGWINHQHSVLTSASIAYFDNDEADYDSIVMEGTNHQKKAKSELDADIPFCKYFIFRDGNEIGSTINNEFVDTLKHLGESTYKIEAHYFNGQQGEPLETQVNWQYPETHYQLVEPTRAFDYLPVNSVVMDREIYTYPIEIAIYARDNCVGVSRGTHFDFPRDILIWKANEEQPESGYSDTDSITIKIWDPQEGRELVTFYSSTNRQFTYGTIENSILNVLAYQPDYKGNFNILNPWEGKTLNWAQMENVVVEWNRLIENIPLDKKISYKLKYETMYEDQTPCDSVSVMDSYRWEINLRDLVQVEEWSDTLDVYMWVIAETEPFAISSDTLSFIILPNSTELPPSGDIPDRYALRSVYPNPFNSQLNVQFDLPEAAGIKLKLFNTLGREIYGIEKNMVAGKHRMGVDTQNLSSGVYIVQMNMGNRVYNKKVIHLQ